MITNGRTPTWEDNAQCAEVVSTLPHMQNAWDGERTVTEHVAINICKNQCPVRVECLLDAIADPSSEGVRGGYHFSRGSMLGSEREVLRREFPNLKPRTRHFRGAVEAS